jgi:hypothetical protein
MDMEIVTFLGLKGETNKKLQQSHGSVQFFEVAVQYKLFSVIKYNKVLVINYYKK